MSHIRPCINAGHRLPTGGSNCDFCSAPSVVRLHACTNFTWEGHQIFTQPVGRWASCYMCSRLVDAKLWGRLTLRVMREVSKRKGVTDGELKTLRRSLKTLHAGFGLHLISGEDLAVHEPSVTRFVVGAGG